MMKTPDEKQAERLMQEAFERMEQAQDATTVHERRRLQREAAGLEREARAALKTARGGQAA